MRHHISTIYLLVLIIVVIASISIFSISKATKLQNLSSSQRDDIRKELFFQEEEVWFRESKSIQNGQLEQNLNFHELIHKPTRVLDHVASHSVIGSALGILLTGCIFAIEGFSGSGISYDQDGWFNY